MFLLHMRILNSSSTILIGPSFYITIIKTERSNGKKFNSKRSTVIFIRIDSSYLSKSFESFRGRWVAFGPQARLCRPLLYSNSFRSTLSFRAWTCGGDEILHAHWAKKKLKKGWKPLLYSEVESENMFVKKYILHVIFYIFINTMYNSNTYMNIAIFFIFRLDLAEIFNIAIVNLLLWWFKYICIFVFDSDKSIEIIIKII